MKEFAVGIVIGGVVSSTVGGAFRSVNERIAQVGDTVKRLGHEKLGLEKQLTSVNAVIGQTSARLNDVGRIINLQNSRIVALKKQLVETPEHARQITNEIFRVGSSIEWANSRRLKLTAELDTARSSAEKLTQQIGRVGTAMESATRHMTAIQRNQAFRRDYMMSMMDRMAAGAAVIAPFKVAVDFESAMADVGKVVDFASKAEEKAFGKSVLEMSRRIPIAASGLASIAAAGGQFGIAKKDLGGFTEMVAKMSTAFSMSAEESGTNVAKIMNIYHLGIGETTRLGDAVNYLGNNMVARERDIVEVMTRIGGSAQVFGLAGKQAAALSSAMLSLGQSPEVAATSLDALLNRLKAADTYGKDFQEGLASIGLNADELKRSIASNAQGTLVDFLERLQKVEPTELAGVLTNMFGQWHAPDIALLVKGLDQYKLALKLTANETIYTGSMQKEFDRRSQTTAAHLQLLKSNVAEVGITVGSLLLPAINSILTPIGKLAVKVTELAEKHPWLTKLVGGLAAGFIGLGIAGATLRYGLTFLTTGYHFLAIATSRAAWSTGWLAVRLTWLSVTEQAAAVKTWALNSALLASPITWIVVGVVALGAALYIIIKHFDTINARIKEFTKRMGIFTSLAKVMQPGTLAAELAGRSVFGGQAAPKEEKKGRSWINPKGNSGEEPAGMWAAVAARLQSTIHQNFYGTVDADTAKQVGRSTEEGIRRALEAHFKHENRVAWEKS